MPLSYPYPKDSPGQLHHAMRTRIPLFDFLFLKRLLPYVDGLSHILLSILLKKLIDELRRIDSVHKLEPTLYIGDPTEQLIESVLNGITFGPSGYESGSDGQRESGELCEEVRVDAVVGTEPQSSVEKRGRKSRSKGTTKEKGK